jgi:hypothetical protein
MTTGQGSQQSGVLSEFARTAQSVASEDGNWAAKDLKKDYGMNIDVYRTSFCVYNGRKLAREGQGLGHMGNLGFHAERERLPCALY